MPEPRSDAPANDDFPAARTNSVRPSHHDVGIDWSRADARIFAEIRRTAASSDPFAAALRDIRMPVVIAEAEMANVRSRARRDVEDAKLYSVQKFATDVVEGVENLRRGLDSLAADQDENGAVTRMRRGFEEVEQNFLALLSRNGVVRDEATGARFDPAHHQAVSARATDEVAPGVIVQQAGLLTTGFFGQLW